MRRLPLSLFLAAGLLGMSAATTLAQPVGTTFTYQGHLDNAGLPVSGLHDLKFRMFDAASGGAQVGTELCVNDVDVVNGTFTVLLDFGSQFTGTQRHLEIAVRADSGLDCTNQSSYDTLAPRQNITPTPYAMFALNGTPGPQGQIGPAGPQGATGAQGIQGVPGVNGTNGTNGAQGPQGPIGVTGATGATGATGPTGANGAVGPAGPQGATGPAGGTPWIAIDTPGGTDINNTEFTGTPLAATTNRWQSFTPVTTGQLSRVVILPGSTGNFSGTIQIYEGQGTGGTLLYTTSFSGVPMQSFFGETFNFPLSEAPTLTAGTEYTFRFTALSPALSFWTATPAYAGGRNDSSSTSDLWFRTGVAPTTTATFDGTVGIGTTTPDLTAELEVNSATVGTGANSWMVRFSNDIAASLPTPATGGLRQTDIGFLEMTNQIGTFTGVARLNNTGNWTASSDRRLKKDIEPAAGNLDAAMRLRPVTYSWIKEEAGSPRHLGFIAQEVREVLPEYVVGDETTDTLTVNYGQMSVVAIGAIQELKAEIDALRAQVKILESETRRLKGETVPNRN